MTSSGFSFPPPPPPPPRPTIPEHDYPNTGRAGWRDGRGRGRGQEYGQGRGRGSGRARYETAFGSLRGGLSRGHSADRYGSSGERGRQGYSNTAYRGQKRRHDQAFTSHDRSFDRPTAPPPVPSFGFDVNSVIAVKGSQTSSVQASATRKSAPKRNVFGLAPSMDDKSSEKDEDEELMLAQTTRTHDDAVQVTYRGQTTSLNTQEDLAAWIAERRKRFPTKAKIDAAAEKRKAEADERSQRSGTARDEKIRPVRSNKQEQDIRQKAKKHTTSEAYKAKADALRLEKELAEAKRRIAELEKTRGGSSNKPDPLPREEGVSEDEDLDILDQSSSDDSESDMGSLTLLDRADETSTSGSSSDSEVEEDEAPAEISSKAPTKQVPLRTQRGKSSCHDFSRDGKCPRGRRCHFKHDVKAAHHASISSAEWPRRGLVAGKSLYQRLQAQQQEMSDELVLQHILYLGDNGYLDEQGS